jgi:hypothetical protein
MPGLRRRGPGVTYDGSMSVRRRWSRAGAVIAHAAIGLLAGGAVAVEPRFHDDVLPTLAANCLACHGFDARVREAGLRLDTSAGATALLDSGRTAIVPGDAAASELLRRIDSDDPDLVMPPPGSGKSLSAVERRVLRDWISAGAVYERHWAFVPPVAAAPPAGPGDHGLEHPIDRFVAARLAAAGLSLSPEAAAETLLRRVHLDLTGLPPTVAEIDDFLAGHAVDPERAYRAVVDRLLESPHYGERMARWWLDQARYADSNGYSIDAPREIWAWRDWVIDAFNRDLPFDRFSIEQLAGDLLPEATLAETVATGFHRNTPLNQEGGIDREQFRVESIFDRVATTGVVWLGLSIGCAQCHDHKFDPVSQRDYYRLFAFLNNQDEPVLTLPPAGADPPPTEAPDTPPTEAPDPPPPDAPAIPPPTTLVLAERSEPRRTTVLLQGDFTRPAEEVTPGTPEVLPPLVATASPPNRLDLARWLVDRGNPLTARVVANRLWQRFFGTGLVETENDFGLMGSPPSHPELLDWLAVELMDGGWSLKAIQRLIVSSRTYRQQSLAPPEIVAIDPRNRLLGRQRRLRLDAEIVRDVGLTASGLLAATIGGPPVFPPIPAGATALGQVTREWPTSTGPDRRRRGLYTFVYRATPPPALAVFDAPDGLTVCTRRTRSTTPLQALTLLNDTAFAEMAEALAGIIRAEGVETAFRRCTARRPSATERAVLATLEPSEAARVLLNLDETTTRE